MNKSELTVGILAGGESTRFKSEKALAKFREKTLVATMVDIGKALSSNVMIVASSEEQKAKLNTVVNAISIIVDPEDCVRCALTGTITALEFSETKYTMILPVDTPLAKVSVLRTIAKLVPGHGAVVPTWPNGYIEPLHSVYLSEHAYAKGVDLLEKGNLKMSKFLDTLTNVLYVSTEVLKHQDPNLETFANINTEGDLRHLENSGKSRG